MKIDYDSLLTILHSNMLLVCNMVTFQADTVTVYLFFLFFSNISPSYSEGTDVIDDLKHVEDNEPPCQSLDSSPKTERGESFQRVTNATGYQSELPTGLNCDNNEDNSAGKKTYKDYYLSPVMLKREISTEN